MHIFVKGIAALTLMCLAGCATWTFESLRSQKFVDEQGQFVFVDYGLNTKDYVSTFRFDYGGSMQYKSKEKVRVELPSGIRFVAYKHMSPTGNLYFTDDEEWEFFQQGTGCLVAQQDRSGKYQICFQGVLCAQIINPQDQEKRLMHGSTPQGFGRESSGPREVKK